MLTRNYSKECFHCLPKPEQRKSKILSKISDNRNKMTEKKNCYSKEFKNILNRDDVEFLENQQLLPESKHKYRRRQPVLPGGSFRLLCESLLI